MGSRGYLPDDVEVRTEGDVLVFSCYNDSPLRGAMRQIEYEGGTVVKQPTRVGKKWFAAVEKPGKWDRHGSR